MVLLEHYLFAAEVHFFSEKPFVFGICFNAKHGKGFGDGHYTRGIELEEYLLHNGLDQFVLVVGFHRKRLFFY